MLKRMQNMKIKHKWKIAIRPSGAKQPINFISRVLRCTHKFSFSFFFFEYWNIYFCLKYNQYVNALMNGLHVSTFSHIIGNTIGTRAVYTTYKYQLYINTSNIFTINNISLRGTRKKIIFECTKYNACKIFKPIMYLTSNILFWIIVFLYRLILLKQHFYRYRWWRIGGGGMI